MYAAADTVLHFRFCRCENQAPPQNRNPPFSLYPIEREKRGGENRGKREDYFYMYQKKQAEAIRIGKQTPGISSDFNSPWRHPQIHTPNCSIPLPQNPNSIPNTQPPLIHLTVQVPSSSSSSTPTYHFHDEPSFQPHSSPQTLLSNSHKRPIMTHSLSSLSHSPTLSSLHSHNHHHNAPDSESAKPLSSSYYSCFLPMATRTVGLKMLRDARLRVRSIWVHLRFLILLSPLLYSFTSNPPRYLLLDFLSLVGFSAAVVISLSLALPRLPSLRLLLARTLPIKVSSSSSKPTSQPAPQVLWSIGSKPKSEKHPDSGTWVQVYSNGDVYEGEFHKGKCTGSGVYYYNMSGKYEGDWIDEKYDGYGVETWAKGSRYRGQYRQGLRHGFGVYRFYTGDVYAGEWCNGQSHGNGVHTCEDGSRYVGEFKWVVKHGLGHYHFRNGDTYAGEYFADKMHGFGIYQFGNEHRYEGAWHEGRRQGLGMYTFRTGETQSGQWENGVLNIASTQSSQPGSPYAVNHSKVLNAVQEARRASEKAYNLEKVDERVNRAVAAANRAANAARVAAVKAVQKQIHQNSESGGVVPISVV